MGLKYCFLKAAIVHLRMETGAEVVYRLGKAKGAGCQGEAG